METPFDPKELDTDQQNRIELLKGEFKSLFNCLADYLSGSRYTSLAITALEEASMWATKSIAFEAEVVAKAESEAKKECCGGGSCCKE